MKYRKKPVVVEAFKFYVDPMPDWFMDKISEDEIRIYNCDYNRHSIDEAYCKIKTLEGVMQGNGGDYIIKGVQGEIYPCKPDIFEMTYDPINKPRNLTVDVSVKDTELFQELLEVVKLAADGATQEETQLRVESILEEVNN